MVVDVNVNMNESQTSRTSLPTAQVHFTQRWERRSDTVSDTASLGGVLSGLYVGEGNVHAAVNHSTRCVTVLHRVCFSLKQIMNNVRHLNKNINTQYLIYYLIYYS